MSSFHLKVWRVEQVCIFELTWGNGQQLTAKLTYPTSLTTLYQTWQQSYFNFYKSGLRARVEGSGTVSLPPIDWRTRLVQAEARLLSEFHYWLNNAELRDIRAELAKAAVGSDGAVNGAVVDVFLTCDSLELARLPWEAWEVGTEFAATKPIRIARSPANIRAEAGNRLRRRRLRVLAILGDETGLNFQVDREAVRSLSRFAEIVFVGWQPGQNIDQLKTEICTALADEQGWDVLFFAGHSNETTITGGELAIAPGHSLLISEISRHLTIAKKRGLQFAIFNSCNGLSIAHALLEMGFSQVAVMREPIHNRVAQEFLLQFLHGLVEGKDTQDALLLATQHLKLERNLTYPSAYLIPSLFRHPDSLPFRLRPVRWLDRLRPWQPQRREAIAVPLLLLLSWLLPVQDWLLQERLLTQAVYRQVTAQTPPTHPPVLLVQIDDRSIQAAGIANPKPMDRAYLARLVDRLRDLKAEVVGIDYLLDRPQPNDARLRQAVQTSVQRQGTWFVFAARQNSAGDWFSVLPDLAQPEWSLQGDIWIPFWNVRPLTRSSDQPLPFAYQLATAHQLTQLAPTQPSSLNPGSSTPPRPNLQNSQPLSNQVQQFLQPAIDRRFLQPITAFSYGFQRRWLQPILDFSLPPERVYRSLPAWKLLENKSGSNSEGLPSLEGAIVILAPGGYEEAGISNGEDNFTLPPAITYWRSQRDPNQQNRSFTGAEAHAYMVHQFLHDRLVVPIPDLWVVLVLVLVGKAGAIGLPVMNDRRRLVILAIATAGYGLVSLQLFLSASVLLPWLLPSATLWFYLFPRFPKPPF